MRTEESMVADQIRGRGIRDPGILEAMTRVPRSTFVPPLFQKQAHADHPLPIGHGQTISQPYIVARMIQLARVRPDMRVLDVGTGSGYQAAVLAEMGARVHAVERIPELAEAAERRLRELGYAVSVRRGDGKEGWPKYAPFDAILVAAASPTVPRPLKEQLATGGRLVMPVGGPGAQRLTVVERRAQGWREIPGEAVVFVPLC